MKDNLAMMNDESQPGVEEMVVTSPTQQAPLSATDNTRHSVHALNLSLASNNAAKGRDIHVK